ncbi:MAG: hypothetical protein MI867_13370 [Pseudomonadales bacterium]|nr:hypothetical protein [Pseudomonadales bacterium]
MHQGYGVPDMRGGAAKVALFFACKLFNNIYHMLMAEFHYRQQKRPLNEQPLMIRNLALPRMGNASMLSQLLF